ncbi:hypothetical protein L6164_031606 [Bauhinia variegata]|uniref:Uncharacterized protein n=1 Tax=Bauhinia variegata TaxID=167791 RepID=A0ACB9LGG4_BAUVA|nr:hypothetical protein L6164_031606 [Bauhinia variegata]
MPLKGVATGSCLHLLESAGITTYGCFSAERGQLGALHGSHQRRLKEKGWFGSLRRRSGMPSRSKQRSRQRNTRCHLLPKIPGAAMATSQCFVAMTISSLAYGSYYSIAVEQSRDSLCSRMVLGLSFFIHHFENLSPMFTFNGMECGR